MALGGSHMSSTVTPTGTQSTLPPPPVITTSTDDSGGDGLQQKGANYFFGFLITFVVLLLVFVGCGIGSRRRFLARRQATFLGNIEPWGSLRFDGAEQPRPVLYEHLFAEPVLEEKWQYTMPLSASMQRRTKDSLAEDPQQRPQDNSDDSLANPNLSDAASLPSQSPAAQTTVNSPQIYPRPRVIQEERAFPSFSVPSWIPQPERKRRSSSDEKADMSEADVDPPEALEVAVMIAMPSSSNPASLHDRSHPHPHSNLHLPEYQIGVTILPWHTELNSTATATASL